MKADSYNDWCWLSSTKPCRVTQRAVAHVFPHIVLVAFSHLFHTATSLWRPVSARTVPREMSAL